mgnify:CR=1 FL=1
MYINNCLLNQMTIKYLYPVPRVDDLIDHLHDAQYFTKIDLTTGYHHIRIAEDDILKRRFVRTKITMTS